MPGTQTRSRSQVVSFSYNRKSRDTTAGPIGIDDKTVSLPVVFQGSAVPAPAPQPQQKPHLVPLETPQKASRRVPFLVKANRVLQTSLVTLCGVAICAYGLDVVVSHDVGRLQQQARRLSEQNSELSAQLLKSISYGELQDGVVGRFGLHVPDQVVVLKEVTPPAVQSFKAHRQELPLMSGY